MTYYIEDQPETIQVGPYPFTVNVVPALESMSRQEWGRCNIMTNEIDVQEVWPFPAKAVDTLIHETLHAIWHTYEFRDGMEEEEIVSRLGTALTALFSDNPDLARWINSTLGNE